MPTAITEDEILAAMLTEQTLARTGDPVSLVAYIDAKERALSVTSLALRAMRNRLVPIATLPSEILIHIFTNLQQSHDLPARQKARNTWNWLTVVKVCRRFHQIVFATPGLWTVIHAGDIRSTRQHILYSKSGPVDVYLDNQTNRGVSEFMQVVGPHIRRVRHLQAFLRRDGMHALLPSLRYPAPQLESLHLWQAAGTRNVPPDESMIVADIFDGVAPSLRSINLRSISLNQLNIGIFSGLIRLRLDTQNPASAPSMDSFIRVLIACPQLELLALTRAGPQLPPGTLDYPTPDQTVDLPRLSSLALDIDAIDLAHLLSHLVIPSTCEMSISVEETLGILRVFPRDCSGLGPLNDLATLKVDITDRYSLSISGTTSTRVAIYVQLDIVDTPSWRPAEFFVDLDGLIPLASLYELDVVNFRSDMTLGQWARILSRVPNLSTLTAAETVDLAQPMALLKALADVTLCPRLEGLVFTGIETTPDIETSIVRCCTERNRRGKRLNTLGIAGRLSKECVTALEKVLDEIELVDVMGRSE